MKSTSQGTVRCRIRSAMKKTAPLSTPDQQQVAALVVGRDLGPELGHARGERLPVDQDLADRRLELRLAPRALRRHAGRLDESQGRRRRRARVRRGPRLAFRPRDLGVDEHVLHLLAAPGEPVARSPASYLKACELGFDRPRAPAHPALERDGVCSSQTRSYSRTAVRPWPRSMRPRAARPAASSRSSLDGRCSASRSRFCSAPGVEAAQQRQQLLARIRPARACRRSSCHAERQSLRHGSRPRSPRAQSVSNGRTTRPRAWA